MRPMHLLLPGLAVLVLAAAVAAGGEAGPIRVEIRRDGGRFQFYRGGQPYYIQGAVYWSDPSGKFPRARLKQGPGRALRG